MWKGSKRTLLQKQKITKARRGPNMQATVSEEPLPGPSTSNNETSEVQASHFMPSFRDISEASSSDSSSDTDSSDSEEDSMFKLAGNERQFIPPCSTPISALVSKKLQKKIKHNKYVDFSMLLPFNHSDHREDFQLKITSSSNLSIVPNKKKSKIYNIEQWTTAFMRYVAIYTQYYPAETPALMKYGELARDLATKHVGNAWSTYDHQFRVFREHTPFPWDQMHSEFWIRATTSALANQSFRSPNKQHTFRPKQKTNFLHNTCWAFNRGSCKQQSCSLPHVCGLCRGQHQAGMCNAKPRTSGKEVSGPRRGNIGKPFTKTAPQS